MLFRSTYENLSRQFTAPEKAKEPYGPEALLHNQFPGTGVVGDPATDQVAAGQGGAFLQDIGRTHEVWAERAGELLDKIGPAVVMTHSAGGPFAWISQMIEDSTVPNEVAYFWLTGLVSAFLDNAPFSSSAATGAASGFVREKTSGAYVEMNGVAQVLDRDLRFNAGVRYYDTEQTIEGPQTVNGVLSFLQRVTKYDEIGRAHV